KSAAEMTGYYNPDPDRYSRFASLAADEAKYQYEETTQAWKNIMARADAISQERIEGTANFASDWRNRVIATVMYAAGPDQLVEHLENIRGNSGESAEVFYGRLAEYGVTALKADVNAAASVGGQAFISLSKSGAFGLPMMAVGWALDNPQVAK